MASQEQPQQLVDPWSQWQLSILLADAAQVVGGKLYILGGGWSVADPAPSAMAIALKISVPQTELDKRHSVRIALLDADGTSVQMGNNAPVEIRAEFEAIGLPETTFGMPMDVPMALQFFRPPLPAEHCFVWRIWINGQTQPSWAVKFATRQSSSPFIFPPRLQ